MGKSLKLLWLGALILALFLGGCSASDQSSGGETETGNNSGGQAKGYPEKTIKLIVPWSAGGGTDAIARTAASFLEKELGAEIIVQNVPGGGGSIGAKKAMTSDPDGYTLLFAHNSIGMSYAMGKSDFDYFDFQPVSLLTSSYLTVASSVKKPWDSMEDIIKDLKADPGSIGFGATIGSTSHLAPLKLADAAGVKFNIVGYEGTAQRTKALIGGYLDLATTTIPAAEEYIKAGKLKLFGITAEERVPALPDVPTLKELGLDVVVATNRGFFFPKGTPEGIVKKVSDALKNVTSNPEFIQKMKDIGVTVNYKGVEEYEAYLKKDLEEIQGVLKRQGVID